MLCMVYTDIRMKNSNTNMPVAVKPAVKPAQIAIATPAVVKPTKVSTRPTEKVLARVDQMSGDKAIQWLNKTARSIANHYDATAKKRKCTETYWNGLITRYDALAKRAQNEKTWESYCKAIGKPVNHEGTAFIR